MTGWRGWRFRRPVLLCLLACLLLAWQRPSSDGQSAAGSIALLDVRFDVVNSNTSQLDCPSDGLGYDIAGTLALPAGETPEGVTLYLHGSGGDAWHFTAVPRVDHLVEMARLGHASVTIDWLGFGASGIPADGFAMCIGSMADIVHQIVGKIRDGSYTARASEHDVTGRRGDVGRRPAPVFPRVALVGHSAGGPVAQTEAFSYDDVDALGVIGYAEYPPTAAAAPLFLDYMQRCMNGGSNKHDGDGTAGYEYLYVEREQFDLLFHNVEPEVRAAFIEGYERDSCGVSNSTGDAFTLGLHGATSYDRPVLIVLGDHDGVLVSPEAAVAWQAARYRASGNEDVTGVVLPDSGHMLMLQRTAPAFRDLMSGWLAERGF